MYAELTVDAALLLMSAISLYRFERRHLMPLAVACVAAGLTFWLSEVGGYVLRSASAGRIPHDALLMAVPVLAFTSLFALILAPPVILLFERLNILGTVWTVVAAGIFSLVAQWWSLGQAPMSHPSNVLVGVVA